MNSSAESKLSWSERLHQFEGKVCKKKKTTSNGTEKNLDLWQEAKVQSRTHDAQSADSRQANLSF